MKYFYRKLKRQNLKFRIIRCRAQTFVVQLVALASFAVSVGPVHVGAVTVEDDNGRNVSLKAPAQRVVSLAPHITELLYAAGAGDKVLGTVQYSDYPAAAQKIPRVGSYQQLDYEQILALQPDLVVAWGSGNPAGALKQLRRLGVNIFMSEPASLEDIATNLERLGELTGNADTAEAAAREFRAGIAELREKYAKASTVSAFYQLWHEPVMTLNGDHLFSDLLRVCGGRNVFADLSSLAPTVSVEAVLERDPQAIIASGTGEQRPEWLDNWKRWPSLQAVQNDHLYFVPPDIIQRHTPRVLQGAEMLCEHLAEVRNADKRRAD